MIRIVWMCLLAVFLILYGIFAVTNLVVEWQRPIMGFSALLAGIFLAIDAVRCCGGKP